jgi:hypothetical protein
VEKIMFLIFKRESNNFSDILNDKTFKKYIYTKITWTNHLIIDVVDLKDDVYSYILLKYGDDMVDFKKLTKDRKPILNVDYTSLEQKEFMQKYAK